MKEDHFSFFIFNCEELAKLNHLSNKSILIAHLIQIHTGTYFFTGFISPVPNRFYQGGPFFILHFTFYILNREALAKANHLSYKFILIINLIKIYTALHFFPGFISPIPGNRDGETGRGGDWEKFPHELTFDIVNLYL